MAPGYSYCVVGEIETKNARICKTWRGGLTISIHWIRKIQQMQFHVLLTILFPYSTAQAFIKRISIIFGLRLLIFRYVRFSVFLECWYPKKDSGWWGVFLSGKRDSARQLRQPHRGLWGISGNFKEFEWSIRFPKVPFVMFSVIMQVRSYLLLKNDCK